VGDRRDDNTELTSVLVDQYRRQRSEGNQNEQASLSNKRYINKPFWLEQGLLHELHKEYQETWFTWDEMGTEQAPPYW